MLHVILVFLLLMRFPFRPWPKSWDSKNLPSNYYKNPDQVLVDYCENLGKLIPDDLRNINLTSPIDFIYTPMHGVGYKYIQRAFQEACLKPVIVVQVLNYILPISNLRHLLLNK